jgi:D-lactate dehydrogenase
MLSSEALVSSARICHEPSAVIIYFTETEPEGAEFFANSLAGHDVRFASRIEDVGEDVEIFSCFIYSKIDSAFLAAHPALKLVATRSTAVDHIDIAACHAKRVLVCSLPFYGDATVAEHTFALILALSRRLREVMLTPKNGRFSYEATRGFELVGKTLGIIGMGRIGQRVAELAHAFQMRVLAYDLHQSAATTGNLTCEFVTLDDLLASSHVISLHAPLSAETYHILNAENLAKCRRGVLVVNTARGSLLDTHALREALNSGQVGGAGLDVLQDERVMRESASRIIASDIIQHLRSDALATDEHDADRIRELQELMLSDDVLSRSNVVFTPHVAFNSVEATERMRHATLENIAGFVAGRPVNVMA